MKGFDGIEYEVMDIFNLTYDDFSFNAVMDKGTLDAVFPEDNPKVKENINVLFKGIFRVLKPGGSYLFISLL